MTTSDLLIDAVGHWTPARVDRVPDQATGRPPASPAVRRPLPPRAVGFQVRLAGGAADVVATQQLRQEVFTCRSRADDDGPALLGAGEWASERVERYFDDRSDHLIVWHQGDDGGPRVVAAARLLPPHANDASPRGEGFAADQHFGLRPLERLLNSTVEVSRVCVHPDHRGGSALALLAAGIARYQHLTGYRYLLGCASMDLDDGGQGAAGVWDAALAGHLAPADRRCRPRDPIAIGSLRRAEHPVLPPFLRACLRRGAKVCGPPGYNDAAGTADFLLLFDVQDAGGSAADPGVPRAGRPVARTGS